MPEGGGTKRGTLWATNTSLGSPRPHDRLEDVPHHCHGTWAATKARLGSGSLRMPPRAGGLPRRPPCPHGDPHPAAKASPWGVRDLLGATAVPRGNGGCGCSHPPASGPAPRCSWCRNWHFMVSKRSMALQAALEGAAAQGESWSGGGHAPHGPSLQGTGVPSCHPPRTCCLCQQGPRLSRAGAPSCYGGPHPPGTTQACPQILRDLVPQGALAGLLPGCGTQRDTGARLWERAGARGPGRDPAVPQLLLPPAPLRRAPHACNGAPHACTLQWGHPCSHTVLHAHTLQWCPARLQWCPAFALCNGALHTYTLQQQHPALATVPCVLTHCSGASEARNSAFAHSCAATVPLAHAPQRHTDARNGSAHTCTLQQCPAHFASCNGALNVRTLTVVACLHTPLVLTIMLCTPPLLTGSHLRPPHTPHSHACNSAFHTHTALHTAPACTSTQARIDALHLHPTCVSNVLTSVPHKHTPLTSTVLAPTPCTHSPLHKQHAHNRTLRMHPTCTSTALTSAPHTAPR